MNNKRTYLTTRSSIHEANHEANPHLVKLIEENRGDKLSQLIKDGVITSVVKEVIADKYVKTEAIALELSKGNSDGFDFLYDVLVRNHPVSPTPNAMEIVVAKLNKAVEHKD